MTSTHGPSPSAPVFTTFTIHATRPPPGSENRRENTATTAYTPKLAAVPLADDPDLPGNKKLVDLLKLGTEQTVKRVIKLDLVPIPTRSCVSHAHVRSRGRP